MFLTKILQIDCLFVCLIWFFSSYSRILHSYEDDNITGKGLQMFTYARHSWSLSSEISLACHTYCATYRTSVYKSHLWGPVTLTRIAEHLVVELSLPRWFYMESWLNQRSIIFHWTSVQNVRYEHDFHITFFNNDVLLEFRLLCV